MEETRKCPYCGEEIRAEATRCRYCRSLLTSLDPERWHRSHPERRFAGVASAVARAFTIPVSAVRLGFVVLAFFHFLGPLLYLALWALIPFAPGEPSPLDRFRVSIQALIAQLAGRPRSSAGTTANGERPEPRHGDGESSGLHLRVVP